MPMKQNLNHFKRIAVCALIVVAPKNQYFGFTGRMTAGTPSSTFTCQVSQILVKQLFFFFSGQSHLPNYGSSRATDLLQVLNGRTKLTGPTVQQLFGQGFWLEHVDLGMRCHFVPELARHNFTIHFLRTAPNGPKWKYWEIQSEWKNYKIPMDFRIQNYRMQKNNPSSLAPNHDRAW